MKNWVIFATGISIGVIVTLALPLPWMKPLDANLISVAAALSSTVLAIAGAYLLWDHQVGVKERGLNEVAVLIFGNLFLSIRRLRELLEEDRAYRLYVRAREENGLEVLALTHPALQVFQRRSFVEMTTVATHDAESALQHWGSVQDAVLSFSRGKVGVFLDLHRVAKQAPLLLEKLRLQGAHERFEFDPIDIGQLKWGLASLARGLNSLDGGSRDDSDFLLP